MGRRGAHGAGDRGVAIGCSLDVVPVGHDALRAEDVAAVVAAYLRLALKAVDRNQLDLVRSAPLTQ